MIGRATAALGHGGRSGSLRAFASARQCSSRCSPPVIRHSTRTHRERPGLGPAQPAARSMTGASRSQMPAARSGTRRPSSVAATGGVRVGNATGEEAPSEIGAIIRGENSPHHQPHPGEEGKRRAAQALQTGQDFAFRDAIPAVVATPVRPPNPFAAGLRGLGTAPIFPQWCVNRLPLAPGVSRPRPLHAHCATSTEACICLRDDSFRCGPPCGDEMPRPHRCGHAYALYPGGFV
jgi:hypothetical protein